MIEKKGFWNYDRHWISLERVQIIAACNPPSDPGRQLLTHRFVRHCAVLFVDYPGRDSLNTIYYTFCKAALKYIPNLRGYAESLNTAMVSFYLECKKKFTPDIQSHYVYSPRELTRWIRGIYEIIKPLDFVSFDVLVRCWGHEALRIFQDRLVANADRDWTSAKMKEIASKCFHNVNLEHCLAEPILFSNYLSRYYTSVDKNELKEFINARLQSYYEEESNIKLILYNSFVYISSEEALEHILRIDRVLRQPQGHLLLVGISVFSTINKGIGKDDTDEICRVDEWDVGVPIGDS